MDTAAIGVAQKEDEEQGVDEEHIFYRMVFFLAAITRGLFSRVVGADDASFRPRMVKIIMRPRARSILATHPAVHGTVSGCHPRLLVWIAEKAGRCPSPGDCAPDGNGPHIR